MLTIKVVFNDYLDTLKRTEKERPVINRRRVPTAREFAEHMGITPTGFSKITNNRTKAISKDFMEGSITLLRSCGFSTTLSDIMEYIPEEEVEAA